MKSYKFVKDTFLKLTSKTYPFGTEGDLVKELTELGILPELTQDPWGNYFYKIGESRTMFTSHLDTACSTQVEVSHIISEQQIISTDGTSILGADDKAGTTIMLWMIKNKIPGLYYFFIGEECGCIGSTAASTNGDFKGKYDRVVSFDRRGNNSVITYQSSYRCCSDEFANELSNQLNKEQHFFYKPDNTGVYTDSAEFVEIVPECTNISVGYQSEHTTRETQDLYHLAKLANAVINVEWETLPVKRDMSKRESRWEEYYNNWYGGYSETKSQLDRMLDEDDDSDFGFSEFNYGWASEEKKEKKKRKRNKRSSGKKFYDNGRELIQIETKNDGKYDIYYDKFLATDLTKDEIKFIKDQCEVDLSNKIFTD